MLNTLARFIDFVILLTPVCCMGRVLIKIVFMYHHIRQPATLSTVCVNITTTYHLVWHCLSDGHSSCGLGHRGTIQLTVTQNYKYNSWWWVGWGGGSRCHQFQIKNFFCTGSKIMNEMSYNNYYRSLIFMV